MFVLFLAEESSLFGFLIYCKENDLKASGKFYVKDFTRL